MVSKPPQVPDVAYRAAARAFDENAGLAAAMYAPAVRPAVDAAAKHVRLETLKDFATIRQGCVGILLALTVFLIDATLYVGVILFVGGPMRWLAAIALVLNIVVQVSARWWNRRARRLARAMLDEELKQDTLS